MTEMTERLKPLGEMFGLPQDFNEDTKDKVTELKSVTSKIIIKEI